MKKSHNQLSKTLTQAGPVQIIYPFKRTKPLKKKKCEGRWSKSEQLAFIKSYFILIVAIAKYGKNWEELQKSVPTRSLIQIRTHSQKFFIRLEQIVPTNIDIIDYIRSKSPKYLLSYAMKFRHYGCNAKGKSKIAKSQKLKKSK